MHSSCDSLGRSCRVLRSANANGDIGEERLCKGDVDLGILVANAERPDVVEYADDLPLDSRSQFRQARNNLLDRQSLLERVQTFQILFDKLLIDHCYAHAGGRVLTGERATLQDLNAEGLEILGCYGLKGRRGALREIIDRSTHYRERHSVAGSEQGCSGHHRSRRNSRYGMDAVENLSVIGVN